MSSNEQEGASGGDTGGVPNKENVGVDTEEMKSLLFSNALSPAELEKSQALSNLNQGYLLQTDNTEKITRVYNWLKNKREKEEEINQYEAKLRYNVLKDAWSQHQDTHNKLLRILALFTIEEVLEIKKTRSYWALDKAAMAEEGFLNTAAYLEEILSKFKREPEPPVAPAFQLMKNSGLPKLDVPTFSGEFKDWLEFAAMFEAKVVNVPGLADIDKYQYLTKAVDERTLNKLSNVPTSDTKFIDACNLLKTEYNNPKKLVEAEMTNLFALGKMTSANSTQLADMIARVDHARVALKKLGRTVEHWDDIIVYRVRAALDPSLQAAWEKKTCLNTQCITWNEFREFLRKKEAELHELEQQTKLQKSTRTSEWGVTRDIRYEGRSSAKVHLSTATNSPVGGKNCVCCDKKDGHELWDCNKFKSMKTEEKSEFVKRKHVGRFVCFNCFGNHLVSNCSNTKNCKTCSGRHHSWLCYRNPDYVKKQPYSGGGQQPQGSTSSSTSGPANQSAGSGVN